MYNTARVFKNTKEDVYKHIQSYDIFKQYLGYAPIVGKVYRSPFREDLNPSFGLFYGRNGSLLFKDFGSGESGDAIKFVKIIEGMHTQEAIDFLVSSYSRIKVKKTAKIPSIKANEIEIYVNKIPWTKQGLAYWAQYCIKEETLKYFKVSQIDKYWVNGIAKGFATENNPMFHYEIYDKDKIYRPYYPSKRFYSNCTSEYIQGWKQLDYSKDTVIITKSMKDVMFLYQLGYTAVAPNGEGHNIPQKALDILRLNFKYVIVMYDWDKAGVCGARRIIRENPDFGFIFTNDKLAKDISDYCNYYGENQTKELLQTKLKYSYGKHFKYRPSIKSTKDARSKG